MPSGAIVAGRTALHDRDRRPVGRPIAGGALVAAALACVACGGGKGGGVVDPQPLAEPSAPADEEHTLAEMVLEATRFRPAALGYPSMTRVTRGKTTLAAARRRVAAKPSAPAPLDAQILATLAWTEADRLAATSADEARALREEARAALAAARTAAGKRADAVTLQMLATAAMWLGDAATAAGAYEELVARFADHEGTTAFRTWLASIYLGQKRVADARALVKGWDVAAITPLEAYVLAWVAFAARDYPAARKAIASAATRWSFPATRVGIERDLVLVLARAGAEVAEAAEAIAAATASEPGKRLALLFALSEAYKLAGDFDHAAATLDRLLEAPPPGPPVESVVAFRFHQADYHFRQNEPVRAAERAIAAYQALPACGAPCAGETAEAVIKRIAMLAQFSHGVFATAQDPAHFDAARTLYAAYLAIPDRPDRATIEGYLKNLDDTRASAPAGQGTHGDKLMSDVMLVRREALTACYEALIVSDPALAGGIRLSLEVSAAGEVTGAATDPAGGQDGLAAVATCLAERVRSWSFPSRSRPGITKIHVPLVLRPRGEGT